MQTLRRHPILAATFAALFAVACGVGLSQQTSTNEPRPVSDFHPDALIGNKKLEVGEECTNYEGNTGCESGLCLRVAPGFPPKGFCTIKCAPGDDDQCPDSPGRWECVQMFPSKDGWVCGPNKLHTSAKATRNGKKVVAAAAAP